MEKISGWQKIQHPVDESMRVSHQPIYLSQFIQAWGVLKEKLVGLLRSKRRIRRSYCSRVAGERRGQLVTAISIGERPAEIEDRAVLGHWESNRGSNLLSPSFDGGLATLKKELGPKGANLASRLNPFYIHSSGGRANACVFWQWPSRASVALN
jgi:hypothetical protein